MLFWIVSRVWRIVGAIILGDRKGVTSIKKLIDQEIDVTKYKDFLLEDDFDYRRILLKIGACVSLI